MLSIWWSVHGVIHRELLPANTTVNAQLYCDQLNRLARKLEGKQDRVYLLHDNARPHTAKATCQKLMDFGWTKVTHPPYSSDFAPSDYHLFRSLSDHLRDLCFDDQGALINDLAHFFASQPLEFYERGIMSLPQRWQQVINSSGQYIV